MNVRKLVALDMSVLGPKVILAEFGIAVVAAPALGLFSLFVGLVRSHSLWQVGVGFYLITLGINYVPLLLYAMEFSRHKSARSEVADELARRDQAFAKYRRQSLLLLVPLLVPIMTIAQERHQARS